VREPAGASAPEDEADGCSGDESRQAIEVRSRTQVQRKAEGALRCGACGSVERDQTAVRHAALLFEHPQQQRSVVSIRCRDPDDVVGLSQAAVGPRARVRVGLVHDDPALGLSLPEPRCDARVGGAREERRQEIRPRLRERARVDPAKGAEVRERSLEAARRRTHRRTGSRGRHHDRPHRSAPQSGTLGLSAQAVDQ